VADESDIGLALSYYRKRIRFRETIISILQFYVFSGIILAISGAGYVMYSKLRINLSENEKIALAISFVGVVTAILSWSLHSYLRTKFQRDVERAAEHQAVGQFIEAWGRFEGAIRKRAFKDDEINSHTNIREAISKLRSISQISPAEQIDAEGLLQFRNLLVHGVQRFPAAEVRQNLKRLIDLLAQFS
jgi:hypothetical protein